MRNKFTIYQYFENRKNVYLQADFLRLTSL